MLIGSEVPGACDALGLARGGGFAFRATGALDGVYVAVHEVVSRGNENDLALFARLSHPTDLGWRAVQGGTFAFAGAPTRVGDAPFDGVIDVYAREAESARALLGDEVRAALLRMVRVGSPLVTDEVAGLYSTSAGLTAGEVVARLRWCAEVARALDARAAALPPPSALGEVAGRFADDARSRGLALRGNALCAEGPLKTLALQVTVRSVGAVDVPALQGVLPASPPGLRLRGRFIEPLGVGLSLRPARAVDRVKDLLGAGDLSLDDPAFDRAWTVTASDPDGARALLHAAARGHLTRLSEAGLRLTLDDRGVEGHGPVPASPDALPELLWLLDALRDVLRPRARTTAYR